MQVQWIMLLQTRINMCNLACIATHVQKGRDCLDSDEVIEKGNAKCNSKKQWAWESAVNNGNQAVNTIM